MSDSHYRPMAWALIVMVVLPMLYALSVGPALVLTDRWPGRPHSLWMRAYTPLGDFAKLTRTERLLCQYVDLWAETAYPRSFGVYLLPPQYIPPSPFVQQDRR